MFYSSFEDRSIVNGIDKCYGKIMGYTDNGLGYLFFRIIKINEYEYCKDEETVFALDVFKKINLIELYKRKLFTLLE